MNSKAQRQDFPGGPVVRALPFHCWVYGFDLWRGWGIRSHMLVQCSQKFFFNNNEKNAQKQQKDWCAGGRARGQGGWNEVSKREGP